MGKHNIGTNPNHDYKKYTWYKSKNTLYVGFYVRNVIALNKNNYGSKFDKGQ